MKFFSVKNIEDLHDESITRNIQAATEEIKDFLRNSIFETFNKISFIGFSMGGIIARGVIENLLQYKDKFGFFMSLSSPHLGL